MSADPERPVAADEPARDPVAEEPAPDSPAAADALADEPTPDSAVAADVAADPEHVATAPVADEPPLTGVPASTGDPGDASLLGLIDRLAVLLERSELSELEVRVGATGLVLRKPSALPPPPVATAGPGPTGGEEEAPSGEAVVEALPAERPSVKAPLTGFWYASPSPGSSPYVAPGGEVAVGQVIGLIEAMKLFNEIKSDLAGRVVKIHAEDGKLVKAKQPLIEVDPL